MSKGIGIGCVVLGIICLLIAVGIVGLNRYEEKKGETASRTMLETVRVNMDSRSQPETVPTEEPEEVPVPEMIPDPEPLEMQTVPAGDFDCIGILSIPVLELELPVLSGWSYEKLKYAPCQYNGSYFEPDFVIAAHNYVSHFGRLSQLRAGDLILFTDVTGTVRCYEVVLLETLPATATEEMITSGFDLSLYTCTPGGGNRVTVRCRTVNP